ncbi:hypothetical protein [Roseimicrobium sp. ORNL1]|uniref:hypothetical protein n=1 Tax=Roseimicrobium sp. ORNL1 TaxID=2711231 RepID=UPI0013E198BE|nr:hypothetical protein [Roseimicrobium sp. ORNL1]QIF05761.1 hypothetical protein G5S37_31115 [Roseimicrobium sp. ORNL1]
MKRTDKRPGKTPLWTFLAASVGLNLAGLGWGLYVQFFREEDAPLAVKASSLAPASPAPTPAPATPLAVQPTAPALSTAGKFQWSQLEAADYPTYISRLRGVACPEGTIKDIISGELRAELAPKRADLERRILRSSDWSPPRGVSRQEYFAAQIRKLEREIELAVSKLMQSAPGLESPAVAEGQSQMQDATPPVRYPAAMEDLSFQDITPAEPGQKVRPGEQFKYIAPGVVEASPEQLASLHQIQEKFVQDLGGPNQDVEDPQYEQNWRAAQWKADQLLRARHGWAAHNNLTRAAIMKKESEMQR